MSCCPLNIITLSTQTDIKAEEKGSKINIESEKRRKICNKKIKENKTYSNKDT